MTDPEGTPATNAVTVDDEATTRDRSTWWIVAGALVVLAVRWWVGRDAHDIAIAADEAGYLGIARLFGHGGVHWNMGGAGTYSPGYGLLVSPWYAISHDPGVVYRGAILTNAVLGALTLPPLYALARRLTPLRPAVAVGAAVAVLVAPAAAGHANWAWAENLTAPVFLLLVLAALRVADRPTPGRALALAGAVPMAFLVHSRLLAACAVALVVLVVAGARRRLSWPWTAGALAVAVGGLLVARRFSAAIYRRLWDTVEGTDQVTNSFGQLTRYGDIVASTVGQGWYLVATTAGVVLLGGWALVRAAAGRPPVPEPDEPADAPADQPWRLRRDDAVVVLAMVGATVATSILFMAGRPRADHLVYGRYNDAVVLPVLLVGIGVLATARARVALVRQLAVVAVLVAGGAWYLRHWHGLQLESDFPRSTILGLLPLSGVDRIRVYHAAAVGLVVVAVVGAVALGLAVARVREARRSALVVGLLAVLALTATVQVDPHLRDDPTIASAPTAARTVDRLVPPGATLRYKTYLPDPGGGRAFRQVVPMGPFFLYQFYLPDHPFYRQTPPSFYREPGWETPPDTPWFFSIIGDPEAQAAGARIAYVDPWTGVALWVEAGADQDRLAAAGQLLPIGFPVELPGPARRGRVQLADAPTSDGRRLVADLAVVSASTSSPWPAHHLGFDPLGTVRLVVELYGDDPSAPVAAFPLDLPDQVPPGGHPPVIEVDHALGTTLPPGRYRLVVSLEQQGYRRFGVPARAEVTVR